MYPISCCLLLALEEFVCLQTSQGMERVLRHKGVLKDIQENRAVDVLPSAKPDMQTEV